MKIVTIPVGLLDTNCYLVYVEASRRLYVIDPGADAPEIVRAARRFDFRRASILLTHAHVDHISAVAEVAAALQVDGVFLAEEDHELYRSPDNALLPYLEAARNLPEAAVFAPNDDFTVIPLPGHTPGGSGFLFRESPALFAGDTIFAGSIGRTDFPGGDFGTIIDSIRNCILTLPDELTIYPGHGSQTTVGAERRSNPYIQ